MFELLRAISGQELLKHQIPALGGSWVIAESFYKFGSFSLECLAFLATWFVLDALLHWAMPRRDADRQALDRGDSQ